MPRKKRSVDPLIRIMKRLRSPDGCPWDQEQDHETIKQCLIEEAYEVVEAIESDHPEALCDELGDLLLQVVFHAQMAGERGEFDFFDVVDRVSEKLVRRHPHVFGDRRLHDAEAVLAQWEEIKRQEKASSGARAGSLMDGVPRHLPALIGAEKLQKKAVKAGLPDSTLKEFASVVRQRLRRVEAASRKRASRSVGDDLGEILFAVAGLARRLKLEPEQLLRRANGRFERSARRREGKRRRKQRA